MTTQENVKPSSGREKALVLVRRLLAEKRAEQKKMVEEYKNDPRKRQLWEELRQENEKRGTPIVKI